MEPRPRFRSRISFLLMFAVTALLLPATAKAAFPGNNGKIAFSTLRHEPNPSCVSNCNSEIYTMNPDGTGQTRLTTSAGADLEPAWSPDGQKIVFKRGSGLWVMNADGSAQTLLTSDGFAPHGAGVGSTCSASTSADAVVPGITPEFKRAVWQLGQVEIYDGGEDGDGDTTGDNTLFATQGLFVP